MLNQKVLTGLSLSVFLFASHSMASQKISDLNCSGQINGKDVKQIKGELSLAALDKADSTGAYLVIEMEDAVHQAISLKNTRDIVMKHRRSADKRTVLNDKKIFTNKVEVQKSGDIKVKNHYTIIKGIKRSIMRGHDEVPNKHMTESAYLSLRADSLWLKEGITKVENGKVDFQLINNISCKLDQALGQKGLKKLKKDVGLIKKKKIKKKSGYNGPSHFFLLPS